MIEHVDELKGHFSAPSGVSKALSHIACGLNNLHKLEQPVYGLKGLENHLLLLAYCFHSDECINIFY